MFIRSIKSEAGVLQEVGWEPDVNHFCSFHVISVCSQGWTWLFWGLIGWGNHHIMHCLMSSSMGKQAYRLHICSLLLNHSLSRDGITGFVDLARGVVMASEEILSTSHYVSIIILPRLGSKHAPIILPHSRYGTPESDWDLLLHGI